MLVLKLTMLEGRTPEQKATLARRLSEAASRHFEVPIDEVRLIIYETPRTDWFAGGRSMAEQTKTG